MREYRVFKYLAPNGGNNGQIQGVDDNTGGTYAPAKSTKYTYDEWSRLSVAETNDLNAVNTWKLTWSYDRYGNRLSQSKIGGHQGFMVYQPQLSINAATNRISDSGFLYDANGNLTNDSLHTYTYDAENRMTKVDTSAGTYTYDGNNLRVKRLVGTTTTTYIFAGSKVIAEYANATLSKEYVYSGSKLLATIAGSATTYSHPDHLSARLETNSSGTTTRTFGHLPFGDVWYETGTANKLKFTSYDRDLESGLDYAVFRFNSWRLGRFMSPDPIAGNPGNPQTLNRYSYVTNDPTNLVDPLGLTGEPPPAPLIAPFWETLPTNIFGGGWNWIWIDTFGGTEQPRERKDWFHERYENCRTEVFGTASWFGSGKKQKSVPSEQVALFILAAAYETGVKDIASFAANVALESNYNLTPTNNPNYSKKTGALLSIDFGPGQVNVPVRKINAGQFDKAAIGTDTAENGTFNGDPYANLVAAANLFKGKKKPEFYFSAKPALAAQRREALGELTPQLKDFYDCITD